MREGTHGEKGTSREKGKGKGKAANHAIIAESSGASPENARRRERVRAMAMEKAGAHRGRHKAALGLCVQSRLENRLSIQMDSKLFKPSPSSP